MTLRDDIQDQIVKTIAAGGFPYNIADALIARFDITPKETHDSDSGTTRTDLVGPVDSDVPPRVADNTWVYSPIKNLSYSPDEMGPHVYITIPEGYAINDTLVIGLVAPSDRAAPTDRIFVVNHDLTKEHRNG